MAENDALSQDEIDALLSMGEDDAPPPKPPESSGGVDLGDLGGMNLDSLLGGADDSASVNLDQESRNALAGGMGSSALGGMGGPVGSGGGHSDARDNVDLLMDVTLRFTVEMGRTTMYIKDVLMLGEGSLVELDKNVGEEVDILINDRIFGRGKLVIMDEYFGVQLTHILDQMERYRNL